MTKADEYVRIDRSVPLARETSTGHNRWHPDIAPIVRVDPGAVVALETRDGFDVQFGWQTTAGDVDTCNLNVIHPLTGSVFVNGAEPGDLLEVTIIEVDPQPFGFTAQVPGFGFLRDVFTEPHIIRWKIEGGHATSAQRDARNALLNIIDWLADERGYTRQQAYAICSAAVDLRISERVDVPKFIVSAFLPLEIFE